jgi:hypothetical protein
MSKASCLSLLSNAVVLWNTLQIERIVTDLRGSGMPIHDKELIHVWPLITPNGVYFVNRTMPGAIWRAIRYRIKPQRCGRHTTSGGM